MAAMIHLDTHVVVWLFAGDLQRLPATVQSQLESHALAVSPMVLLELAYLHEVGRITQSAQAIFDDLALRIGLVVLDTPFAAIIAEARQYTWTRDPFDRIIAAQAAAENATLITADQTLLRQLNFARWS